jgi:periplasmic protein TonB
VLLRVLVGLDGKAQEVKLQQTSGFDRLDNSALQSVSQWRFVPGKRGGVPEAMWHVVPITFILD